ncbi:Fibrocystin-L, partial [Tetrabaena socialis]
MLRAGGCSVSILASPQIAIARVSYEGNLYGGQAIMNRAAFRMAADGTPYMFQQHAEITGVWPPLGSAAGGTLLTISGRGFPTLDLGLGDTVNVTVQGAPCRVLASNFTTLLCETSPLPYGYVRPTPLNGTYPGMRGIEYEFYNASLYFGPGISSNLWRLNSSVASGGITVDSTPGSYRSILTGMWESPPLDNVQVLNAMAAKTYFIAPRDGDYNFHLSCDDACRLNGTYAL